MSPPELTVFVTSRYFPNISFHIRRSVGVSSDGEFFGADDEYERLVPFGILGFIRCTTNWTILRISIPLKLENFKDELDFTTSSQTRPNFKNKCTYLAAPALTTEVQPNDDDLFSMSRVISEWDFFCSL